MEDAKARAREVALRNLAKAHEARTSGRVKSQAEVLAEIRKSVEAKLKKEAKATLGDYIRLVQLQKDLAEGETTEIRVSWVEEEKPA